MSKEGGSLFCMKQVRRLMRKQALSSMSSLVAILFRVLNAQKLLKHELQEGYIFTYPLKQTWLVFLLGGFLAIAEIFRKCIHYGI